MPINRILFIGGHGMLGRPVVRRMVEAGFAIRVMARFVERAESLLPPEVGVVQGTLESLEDIRNAAEDMEAVFLNLASNNPKLPFNPELDGTRNVIEALKDHKEILLAKVSSLGVMDTHGDWLDADTKFKTEKMIRESGHPYLIFRPTWFMESLPIFMKDRQYFLFVKKSNPLHWIAGDDFARQAIKAVENESLWNEVYNLQGQESLTFQDAAKRFIQAYDQGIKIKYVPLPLLGMVGWFNPPVKEFYKLMKYTMKMDPELKSEKTWELLGKPTMSIEDYVEYIRKTGDLPSKRK